MLVLLLPQTAYHVKFLCCYFK